MNITQFPQQLQSFKELKVWQRSITLCKLVYKVTKNFPKEELFGLVSQMRRSAISISSNIAEGSKRNGTAEFIHFLGISEGSLAELETQVIIASEVALISPEDLPAIEEEINAIGRMLIKLQRSLKTK